MTNIKVVHSIHPRLEPAPHLIEPQVGVPRATPPPPVPGTTPPPPTPLPVVGVVPVVGVLPPPLHHHLFELLLMLP
ncbi:conserved hypothetical protein [Ricinus communis]|uniref:Uncharacterized protein n=1 Tax=Ricinus communis TaxID=3988 RepID=B9RX44_RICCO|nr:conserved hypothetical protein [Ricinus communis]